MQLRGMIFDFDGTLGDTVPICIQAFQRTFHHYLGHLLPAQDIVAMFGPSEEGMLQRQLPQTWPQALDMYLEKYARTHATCRELFPGLLPLLTTLQGRGVRLGIVTGKGPRSASISAHMLGLDVFFIGRVDWLALDRGTLSQQDAIVRAARRTGLSATAIGQFFEQMSTAWMPIAGTVDLLHCLHVKGYPLFCLSNMHVASLAYLEQAYAFWAVFTGMVISCRVQLIKPEPANYAHVLAQYGLEASHTVFIDDTAVNLAAAAQLGIHSDQGVHDN